MKGKAAPMHQLPEERPLDLKYLPIVEAGKSHLGAEKDQTQQGMWAPSYRSKDLGRLFSLRGSRN